MPTLKTTAPKPIISNADASLIDIGDGIARLELHSKLNIIGDEMLEMFDAALDEVETNYVGMVIATEAKHFSVGLNLTPSFWNVRRAKIGTLFLEHCVNCKPSAQNSARHQSVVAATAGMALGAGANSFSVRMPSKPSLKQSRSR